MNQSRKLNWQSDFSKFLLSDIISTLGTQLTTLAIPLTAVLILNASPIQLGLIGTLGFLPSLLFNLFAGVWIDRLPRRPVLIATNLALSLVYGSIPLANWFGFLSIEYFYITTFLVGTLKVFFYVAYQAYLPTLVLREQLTDANSKLEATNSVATIVGPGLGGWLVQLFTAPVVIALDALSYFFSAGLLSLIQTSEPPTTEVNERRHILAEIGEGLQVVFGNRLLRAIVGCTATGNFAASWMFSIYTLYAVRVLKLEPSMLGLIAAISGVGALIGAVFASWVARHFKLGTILLVSNFLISVGNLSIPLATGSTVIIVVILIAGQFLASVMILVYQINQISIRQSIIPVRLQGRASASTRFVAIGVGSIGALTGGFLGDALGLQPTLLAGALVSFLGCLWILLSPLRTLTSLPPLLTEKSEL